MCVRVCVCEVSGMLFGFVSSGTVVLSGPERSVIDGAIIGPVTLPVLFLPFSYDFSPLAFLLYNKKHKKYMKNH